VSSATKILTNTTTTAHSATNLFLDFSRFPQRGVTVYMTATNVVVFRGLDITLTQGGTWASVATSTLTSTNLHSLMIPFASLTLPTRTNQAVEIFDALTAYATGFTNGGASSGGITTAGNAVFVSKVGADGTGDRGDFGKQFLTLSAAKAAATSGDTVFVFPGAYSDTDLLKDGVNWHFYSGASVTNSSGATAIFDDSGGAVTSTITGDGVFVDPSSFIALYCITTNSIVRLHAKSIQAVGDPAVVSGDGTLTIEADEVLSAFDSAVAVSGLYGSLTFNRTRIKTTSGNPAAVAVNFGVTNNDVTLRDCILISGGTYSIDGTASDIRLYGSTMANVTNSSAVTILTGASRFEVDTDVR
jgi:hypothetical protein